MANTAKIQENENHLCLNDHDIEGQSLHVEHTITHNIGQVSIYALIIYCNILKMMRVKTIIFKSVKPLHRINRIHIVIWIYTFHSVTTAVRVS